MTKFEAMTHELEACRAEHSRLTLTVVSAQTRQSTLAMQIKILEQHVAALAPYQNVVITDHAVLRYLERVHGIGIEEVKEKILPSDSKVRQQIAEIGEGRFPVGPHRVRVRDGKVVTITPMNEEATQ